MIYTMFLNPLFAAHQDDDSSTRDHSPIWRNTIVPDFEAKYNVAEYISKPVVLDNTETFTLQPTWAITERMIFVLRVRGSAELEFSQNKLGGGTVNSTIPMFGNGIWTGANVFVTKGLTSSPIFKSLQDGTRIDIFAARLVDDDSAEIIDNA